MPRSPKSRRDFCQLPWEDKYGTTAEGNLPQYKRYECIGEAVDLHAVHSGGLPWVRINDFHHYHIKCPYGDYTTFSGVVSGTLNYIRDTDTTSSGYWMMYQNDESERTLHTATSGMMIRYSRGSVHGWLCVDPDCWYFLNTGNRYFYI